MTQSIWSRFITTEPQDKTPDRSTALKQAIELNIRPVVITSITVRMGLHIFLFSYSPQLAYFGGLATGAMFVALTTDLLLLPALILTLYDVG